MTLNDKLVAITKMLIDMDKLINATKTGELRNKITDANILLLQIEDMLVAEEAAIEEAKRNATVARVV